MRGGKKSGSALNKKRRRNSTSESSVEIVQTVDENNAVASEVSTKQPNTNDVATTTSIQSTNQPIEAAEYDENIEDVKEIAWKLFNLHDKEMRKSLHIEYLKQYVREDLVPKGLSLYKRPAIKLKAETMDKWRGILHNASLELMKLLIQAHEEDLQEVIEEKDNNQNQLASKCPPKEKESFINEIIEDTRINAEKIRENKEKKLQRDRNFKEKNSKRKNAKPVTKENNPEPSKESENLKSILKNHIKKKLFERKTELKSKKEQSREPDREEPSTSERNRSNERNRSRLGKKFSFSRLGNFRKRKQ